jgi:hypothetical protein
MADQMELFEMRGMNHALWVWDPAWEPWVEEVNAFNFRLGPDPDNHADQPSNEMMETILRFWSQNTVRLSSAASGD